MCFRVCVAVKFGSACTSTDPACVCEVCVVIELAPGISVGFIRVVVVLCGPVMIVLLFPNSVAAALFQTALSFCVLSSAVESSVAAMLQVLLAAAPEIKKYSGAVELFRELNGYSDAPRTKAKTAAYPFPVAWFSRYLRRHLVISHHHPWAKRVLPLVVCNFCRPAAPHDGSEDVFQRAGGLRRRGLSVGDAEVVGTTARPGVSTRV